MTAADLGVALPFEGGMLAPMESRHSEHVVRWRNDPAIASWFLIKHRFTVEGHDAWLASAQASGTDFNWIIEDDMGRPVGAIGLYDIDWAARRGEIGRILIGESDVRRRGYARRGLVALLDAATRAGLDAIELVVMQDNAAATKLYETIGFRVTGAEGTSLKMRWRAAEDAS